MSACLPLVVICELLKSGQYLPQSWCLVSIGGMNVHSWSAVRHAPINIVMSLTVKLEGAGIWNYKTGPTDMGQILESIADAGRKSRPTWHQIKGVNLLKPQNQEDL